MIRSINYCFQHKIVASFYCDDCNAESHLVGYIEKFNDSEILIAHISPHGYYDGFILKQIADIHRIDYDGEYEKKVKKLYELRKQSHSTICTFNPDDDEILYSLLDFSKENDYVVSLVFADSSISGFVNGYSDDVIYLEIISDYGVGAGISIINTNEVLAIAVDTDLEQDLKLLHDNP